MPHQLHYARQGGFRRSCRDLTNVASWHGFGGFGYPQYLNQGMYGGYRSHYNYYNQPKLPLYQIPQVPPQVVITSVSPATGNLFRWLVVMFILTVSFIMSFECSSM